MQSINALCIGISREVCEKRGCCWSPLEENSDEPWCFYPEKTAQYIATSSNKNENHFYGKPRERLFWKEEIKESIFTIDKCFSKNQKIEIYRIRITDRFNKRYEHLEEPNIKCSEAQSENIKINFSPFSIQFKNQKGISFGNI